MKTRETSTDGIEARAFVEWMVADHFTFLGHRDYELIRQDGAIALRGVPGSGVGLLRESLRPATVENVTLLSPAAVAIVEGPMPVFLTKAQFARDRASAGLSRLCGREAPRPGWHGDRGTAVHWPVHVHSPTGAHLRNSHCAAQVREHRPASRVLAKGHLYKSLLTVLEQYPREELFEADEDVLFDTALGVLRLQEHQRTRLFVRRDRFDRFVSCLVFVSRDKFNTDLRKRIAKGAHGGIQRQEHRGSHRCSRSLRWRASTSRCARKRV